MVSSTVFRQLYLFDCDGDRSSLFSDKTKLSQLPNNCELYLFWHRHDSYINTKLEQLKPNSQVHLCGTHSFTIKNPTGAKLIYFVGKLVNEFSKIVLVQGNDKIYQEVIETVREKFSRVKIDLHGVKDCKPSELASLIKEMQASNLQNNYMEDHYELIEGNLKIKSPGITIDKFSTGSPCGKTLPGVVSHFPAEHPSDNSSVSAATLRECASKTN